MTETFEKYLKRQLINALFGVQVKDCFGKVFTVKSVEVKSGYDGLEIHFFSKNGKESMCYSSQKMPEIFHGYPDE